MGAMCSSARNKAESLNTEAMKVIKDGGIPSSDQVNGMVKDMLGKAADYANEQCGQKDAFKAPDMEIPLPEELEKVRDVLKKADKEEELDELKAEINKAAEVACKDAGPALSDAIKEAKIEEATDIMKSESETSGTDYVKDKFGGKLQDLMSKSVKKGLEGSQAAQVLEKVKTSYNEIKEKGDVPDEIAGSGMLGGLAQKAADAAGDKLPDIDLDLEKYVSDKGMDAVFKKMGEQEVELRKDPAGALSGLAKNMLAAKSS